VVLAVNVPMPRLWQIAIAAALAAMAAGAAIALRAMRGTWDPRRGARPRWRERLASVRDEALLFSELDGLLSAGAPDFAIVGEVRDREALPLLLTLSSGVKGFTTIHAGSARQALTRLRFICQLADRGSELPFSALSSLVTEAVDIVVHCSRTPRGLRVTEVLAVEELQTGPDSSSFTTTELFRRAPPEEPLRWTGNLPVRAARPLQAAGYDVRRLLDPHGAGPGAHGRSGRDTVPPVPPVPPVPLVPADPALRVDAGHLKSHALEATT